MSRHVVIGLFVALLWSTNAIAAPGEPTPAGSAMPALLISTSTTRQP